ncbi:hypothetical protein ACG873_00215 (plasmid) [Mesorhizobium sp. AaZ16]|uniref:hypothetical protein n=1 Tax=Mesorhizobium sp. AaZ16 TaxID=3402289 RepID=UPI00374F3D4E
MGVVQDQVFEVDELALEPERGGRVGKILAFDKAVAYGAGPHALVKAGQNRGRLRDGRDDGVQVSLGS